MKSRFNFSIIICTRNRARLLKTCLDSILEQIDLGVLFETLVIDNMSSDETAAIIESSLLRNSYLRSYREPKIGLSNARNTGAERAQSNWLVFIDDDVVVDNNFAVSVSKAISMTDFAAFGGIYWPRYEADVPSWIPADFFACTYKFDDMGRLEEGSYLSGLCMIVERSYLNLIGGFPTWLGMVADKSAYGEETYVQKEIRRIGGEIGVYPTIQVEHIVRDEKLTLKWHLRSAYAKGRDLKGVTYNRFGPKAFMLKLLRLTVVTFPRCTFLWFTSGHYKLSNLVFDVGKPLAMYLGKLRANYLPQNNNLP